MNIWTLQSMAGGHNGGHGPLVLLCADIHRKKSDIGDATTPCHSLEGRTAQGKNLTSQIKKSPRNASIILPAQVNNQIKLIDFEAFLLPTRKSHHRVAVSCMNIIIIHDFPPSRYQSFFVLMRVPQSIGMTIMKKFTNKQIVKFQWYEKSLSEQLDIIDSIDILQF